MPLKPTFMPEDSEVREAVAAYERDNPRKHPYTLTNNIGYHLMFAEWLVGKLKDAKRGSSAAEDYARLLTITFEQIRSCSTQLQCRMAYLNEITAAGEAAPPGR